MHVEQGCQLMQHWHLPEIYCQVVAGHEAEPWDHGNVLLAMVRLADQTCKKLGIGVHPDPSLMLFASPEVQVLGLKEIALAELEIVVEDALKKTHVQLTRNLLFCGPSMTSGRIQNCQSSH